MFAVQWWMNTFEKTWPEPGANGVHYQHTETQHFAEVPPSRLLSASGLQSLGLWSIWGHADVFCCPVCSLTDIKDTDVQKQKPDRDAWRDRGNGTATPERVESFSQVDRRRRFPFLATWRCCCSSARPDLLRPPPHFPSQQPPPSVTSPPRHRILWKPRGRRVSNHSSSQSGHRNKTTGSRLVKNIRRCFSKLAGLLVWS